MSNERIGSSHVTRRSPTRAEAVRSLLLIGLLIAPLCIYAISSLTVEGGPLLKWLVPLSSVAIGTFAGVLAGLGKDRGSSPRQGMTWALPLFIPLSLVGAYLGNLFWFVALSWLLGVSTYVLVLILRLARHGRLS